MVFQLVAGILIVAVITELIVLFRISFLLRKKHAATLKKKFGVENTSILSRDYQKIKWKLFFGNELKFDAQLTKLIELFRTSVLVVLICAISLAFFAQ
jgi:hypothetical protein